MPSGPREAPFFDLGVWLGRVRIWPVDQGTIDEDFLPEHALALFVNSYSGQTVYLNRHDATALMMAIQVHLAALPPEEE